MPSLRAVTWEQGRGRVGCRGCRDPFVGRAGEGTRTVPPHPRPAPAEGQPSAPGSQHTPFPAAHTRTHTHRCGLFQVSWHGQGKSGAQPPPRLHLKAPRHANHPRGSALPAPRPGNPGAFSPLQQREGVEFHASSPAHPMDLIQPLAAGAAQVSAALPSLVQSALVTRENAAFLSKPARPGLIQGCKRSKKFVQARTSLTRCCGGEQRATDPRNSPQTSPQVWGTGFHYSLRARRANMLRITPLRDAGRAINYTNAISREHYKHRQEESQSCS